MRRQARWQAASLRRMADRCRSDCSGWRETRFSCARVTAASIASTLAVRSVSFATTGVPPAGEDREAIDQEAVFAEHALRRLVRHRHASAATGFRPNPRRRRCARCRVRSEGRSPLAARATRHRDNVRASAPTRAKAAIAARRCAKRRFVRGELERLARRVAALLRPGT